MNIVKIFASKWLRDNGYEVDYKIQEAVINFAHEIDNMLDTKKIEKKGKNEKN